MIRLASILIVTMAFGLAHPAPAASRNTRMMLAQNPAPEICTEVYQPVCGTDQTGKRATYANACFARVAKATAVTPGECAK